MLRKTAATGRVRHCLRTGIAIMLLTLSLAGVSPTQAQDALDGLALGAFLNKALDQIDQAIHDAQNAGNAVAIGVGREAALAIQNAQNAYADSLNKTAAQLDKAALTTAGQIKSFTNDITSHADLTVNNATDRVQQITDTLPFANKEPQVRSVSPPYIVPKDAASSNDLEINFLGNFPGSSADGYAPYLKSGGKTFQAHNTTDKLTFLIPQGVLFSQTAPQANRLQFANVSLILPWQADKFFGLFHTRREDHFDVLVGSLPASPGTITVIHTVTGTIPAIQDFCSGNYHQASTKEAGNNDDKDHHWPTTPDSGWHVVRGTSHTKIGSVQGDVALPSLVSDDADSVVYTATTIHHTAGSSGSIDFSVCFKETQDQPTSHADSQPVALKWGDSKAFDYASGTWQVTFVDFTGTSSDFRAPDNHNPFLIVDEQGGKLLLRIQDPDKLKWP